MTRFAMAGLSLAIRSFEKIHKKAGRVNLVRLFTIKVVLVSAQTDQLKLIVDAHIKRTTCARYGSAPVGSGS